MLLLLLRRLAICKETGIILILLKRESKVNCKVVSLLRYFLSLFPLVLMITFSGGCAGLPPTVTALRALRKEFPGLEEFLRGIVFGQMAILPRASVTSTKIL